ncbi:hypothetical protein RFI_25358 [Reticulomyxa filosa]|uniref:Uncharacterized protein n=1 Tax=Reticulomyxa filosa TaxID=46433 RepID=X6MDB7_RETFI|nr:hypothetical protein RFI_25358 [Reticulomyxa filosa]|eukprot:ETO12018.1 hypothetical protein RFI_25358 [Reticulomyxa filosa]
MIPTELKEQPELLNKSEENLNEFFVFALNEKKTTKKINKKTELKKLQNLLSQRTEQLNLAHRENEQLRNEMEHIQHAMQDAQAMVCIFYENSYCDLEKRERGEPNEGVKKKKNGKKIKRNK